MVTKTSVLVEHLQSVIDPRRQCRNLKHPLVDVLALGFCGVLAGCDDFVEIAAWARTHQDFWRTFLALPHGVPSHDTFTRVWAMVRPEAVQVALLAWLQHRRGLPGELVHIDGKTMRRTRSGARGLAALHLVSAWASQHGLTLGQVAVDGKSNEITAIPHLLDILDLRDKIVTIDAAGCQKGIATQVVDAGGDYVLAVKDNQPTLHAEMQQAFANALEDDAPQLRRHAENAQGHGRTERRIVWVLPAAKYLSSVSLAAWAGLATLVMVVRVATCARTAKETTEVRYFISSVRPSARRLARAIRSHWSIENGLHWVLDVVFREDARRLLDRTAAQNVGFLNRLAVSLLRADAAPGSLKVKRKRAGWDIHYLAQLLGLASA
jgi:predicted transposase YbfD/YdcC